MAFRTVFTSHDEEINDSWLECFKNGYGNIFISIESESMPMQWVSLDKETAIKLAKVLRTEINKIQ